MVINLNETIPYYMYSYLQMLQDYQDELAALHSAKTSAELNGAMYSDLVEFDIEIDAITFAIREVKSLAN